jgi:hypothetical protein
MAKKSGAFGGSAGPTSFHSSLFCWYCSSTDDVAPYRQDIFVQQVLDSVLESRQEKTGLKTLGQLSDGDHIFKAGLGLLDGCPTLLVAFCLESMAREKISKPNRLDECGDRLERDPHEALLPFCSVVGITSCHCIPFLSLQRSRWSPRVCSFCIIKIGFSHSH